MELSDKATPPAFQCFSELYFGQAQASFYHRKFEDGVSPLSASLMALMGDLLTRRLALAPIDPVFARRTSRTHSPLCSRAPVTLLRPAPVAVAEQLSVQQRPVRVTVVNRARGRRILNVEALRAAVCAAVAERTGRRCVSSEVFLERLLPVEQFALVKATDVFVHMWGGASAFVPLLQPNSTAVAIFAGEFSARLFTRFANVSALYSRSHVVYVVNDDLGRLRFPSAVALSVQVTGNASNATLSGLKRLAQLAEEPVSSPSDVQRQSAQTRAVLQGLAREDPFFASPCFVGKRCYEFW
jgi:hypothetical protein